ncbi:hypothetical protein DVH24_023673 [Malus domestica]|uniref:Uncharacterized protein n=1 Tax=Malus domestica TaxID=3750 RepID=A0A498I3C7_MALDO|nr:hypothetical protein DVH24_023673 [Malus domestica]
MWPPLPSDLSFRGCERGVMGDAARSRGGIACAFAWSDSRPFVSLVQLVSSILTPAERVEGFAP